MKIKYSLLSVAVLLTACSFLLDSCTDGDDFKYNKNGLLVTGTEKVNVQKFVVEDTPSAYGITVKSTKKVDEDVNLTMAIDTSLVTKYNSENGSSYYPIPLSCVELDNPNLTIDEGSAVSTSANVKVTSTEDFVEGLSYLIPVTIKSVDKGDVNVIDASRTIFLRVSRVISFNHLSYGSGASSNYIFPDNKMVNLTAYTIQFKFWSNGFGSVGNIKRVLSIEGKNENEANMFRFGENGSAGGDILQWVLPGGRAFSSTHFNAQRWYLITCTYDGSTFKMYVDDNPTPDATADGAGKSTPFQRFELGMSWGGYNSSQYFSGRLAEIRLWNRALSTSEIATGLCGVDVHSDGLVAYWKLNQKSGTTILDVSGNGYDMDWNDTWRSDYEGDLIHHTDYGSKLTWAHDDNDKCSQ
jgi:hypothetical protein